MKKLNIMAAMMVGLLAFASCDSDRDDNPVLTVPESFNLLKPEIGDNVIDLASSTAIEFKAEKAPNYSFPLEANYWLQITGEDNASFADADKIFSLSTTSNSITYKAPTNEVDLCVMKVKGWEDETQVNKTTPVTLNVRLVACPKNLNDSANYVYSTIQQIKVYPYFIKESLPKFWYITGSIIGNEGSTWKNDPAFFGTGMQPMYVKKGAEYDKFSGDGVVEWVGYLAAGGQIKFIEPKGLVNWNYSLSGGTINEKGGSGFAYRDGGDDPGNTNVEAAGYYVIDINTSDHSMTVKPYTEAVSKYTSVKIGDNEMAAVNTVAGMENHDWFATITLSGKTNMVFTANDGTTWGSSIFPCAIGSVKGSEIPCDKGTYKVFFNDITGAYSFVEQK